MREVVIPGDPVPKGRPRMSGGHFYTPKETLEYEALVKHCWQEQNHGEGFGDVPLMVSIECYMPIPASWSDKKRRESIYKYHVCRPDLDNIVKAVLDGLNGVAYSDDKYIVNICASKLYGNAPCVRVRISEAEAVE